MRLLCLQEKGLLWSLEEARCFPEDWQCLLMKRNYADFAWDSIGGNSEPQEFPLDTMQREVFEEVGWKIKDTIEVCRQWKNSVLEGFVYVSVPNECRFFDDAPPYVLCNEVACLQYFDLNVILNDGMFKSNIKNRIQAFLAKESDFSL